MSREPSVRRSRPIRRTRLLFVCALTLLALPAAVASGAQRMWVGFQDDPSFRWREDRAAMLDQAAQAGAGIIRTTVYWSNTAPARPASPTNPFDSAYRFDDVDDIVRSAQFRGMEVMLTIWGTPGWANGGKGQNRAPTNVGDLADFAQAVASRYSGRFPGYPFVRYFSVWNEPNLEQFLAPTFNNKGKPASPFTYAKLYRAAYAGIKAGNPRALVGLGETSPRGRDRLTPAPGRLQNTISPGTFARLVSTVRPALRFDAWAHHPYSTLGSPPAQQVRWPNVNLQNLPRFEEELNRLFRRKSTPIWITEYGFETKPGEPKGVTVTQQATYAKQSLETARSYPFVDMYIWFILRDDPTSLWQSGLLSRESERKPAFATFSAVAKLVDARSPILSVARGVTNPLVKVPVIELAARSGVGATLGATVRVYVGSQLVGVAQPTTAIGFDGWASFPAPVRTQPRRRYTVTFDINDQNGNQLRRTATLVVS